LIVPRATAGGCKATRWVAWHSCCSWFSMPIGIHHPFADPQVGAGSAVHAAMTG
jgi:hypothetical protein